MLGKIFGLCHHGIMIGHRLAQVASCLNIFSSDHRKISHFAFDSRLISPGGLFFAIKGQKVDGHLFLEEVAKKGAFGAIVSKSYTGPHFGLTLIFVEDVTASLQQLGAVCKKPKTVAITGSMGKTTVKEFLATLLEGKYRVFKTPGNQNTQLSLPLSLLNRKGEHDVLVLEMAMSEKGQIKKLVNIAPPTLAIVTRIAPAAMDKELKEIAKAKGEIFSHPQTRWGLISSQAAKFPEILYGGCIPKKIYGKDGDFTLKGKGNRFAINDSPVFQLNFSASHLVENFLGAVSAARMLGVSWYEIEKKVQELKPFSKRFETIEKKGITFISDCYNANPDSMVAALQNLPKRGGKIVGVLGEMPDLGVQSEYYHKQVGEEAKKHLDHLLCIGKGAEPLLKTFSQSGKPSQYFAELSEIKCALERLIKPGDVVLVKGANRLKLWELLED